MLGKPVNNNSFLGLLGVWAFTVACNASLVGNAYSSEEHARDLNLHLDYVFAPPPVLASYSSPDYMSLYEDASDINLKSSKGYPLGLTRFKADKGMRVRGWEIRDNIYFGQAKVGKKWGLGLVVDRGSHYYGINNRGVSFLKKF